MQYDNLLYITGQECEIFSAAISASSSGDNEIVAAVSGKKIGLLGYSFTAAGAVSFKWRSATTDKTGLMPISEGIVVKPGRVILLATAASQALNLNLSGAIAVGGHCNYIVFV